MAPTGFCAWALAVPFWGSSRRRDECPERFLPNCRRVRDVKEAARQSLNAANTRADAAICFLATSRVQLSEYLADMRRLPDSARVWPGASRARMSTEPCG